MKNNELRALLGLSLIGNVGARRIHQLIRIAETPSNVFKLSRNELSQIDGIGGSTIGAIFNFKAWDEVDRILDLTPKIGAKFLTIEDEEYPSLLKQIYDPPVILWVLGDIKVLSDQSVGIVGTRKASSYGLQVCDYLTRGLVEKGITVCSGLAYGIDARAHKETIASGGKTVAVLGSGVDRIYPGTHRSLVNSIIENSGAVISEYPLGTKPDAPHFPVRNRIISGLSKGVLVIESGIKGGSMITARGALDQNREVFAVPHPLLSTHGQGCNKLIQEGLAKLVQTVEDILIELRPPVDIQTCGLDGDVLEFSYAWRDSIDTISKSARAICEILEEKEEVHVDILGDMLGYGTSEILAELFELEMNDLVSQKPGKYFSLRARA